MMSSRRFGALAVAVAVALVVSACGSSDDGSKGASAGGNSAAAKADRQTFYFATFAIANSFWAPMRKGAEEAGKQTGNDVKWTQGTKFSTPDTVKRMEVAIASKPDVMIVTDIDPPAFEPLMERAQKAGITVINTNAKSPKKNPPYLMYIGADEYLAGQEAARRTLDHKKPKRAACEIQVLESAALQDRCRGYRDVMRQAGVAADTVNVAGTPSEAQSKMQGYFTSRSDADAAYLLTADPAFLTPMLRVKEKLASRDITFVTNDTSEAVFKEIIAGSVLGTMGQQQYLQGYLAVIYADLYQRFGFRPAGDILTGPFWIDKSTVSTVQKQVEQGVG